MRGKDALLPHPGAWLLLLVGSLLPTAALAETGVWTSGGPYGGYVSAMAASPAAPSTLYAGLYVGGVYRSTDAGRNWVAANEGLTDEIVYAVAVHPSTPTTLFVGTDSGGVFKSTDSGGTWAAAGTGLPIQREIFALAIDPSNPATIYAGMGYAPMGYGVYKSTNSGVTWTTASNGLSAQVNVLAIHPANPTVLYAGTDRGVFKSVDGGGTWVNASVGLTNQDVLSLAINPVASATLYAGTNGGGIFRSTDSGGTWVAVNTGLTNLNVKALAVIPSAPATLYAGTLTETMGGSVFKSTDAGTTWTAASMNLGDLPVFALSISPADPATIFAGTFGGGVFRSTDSGGTWSTATSGMTALAISALAFDPSTPSTLYAAGGDFWGGGVFKSTDSGATWANTGPLSPWASVFALAVDPSTPSTLYAGWSFLAGGVFKSTDAGNTWTAADTGLGGANVRALAIDLATPTTLYAGTELDGVFKSTDSGATWAATNTGLNGGWVNALAISPSTPTTVYAGTDRGVFKSTDAGSTWLNAGPPPNNQINALAIDPASPATVYAGGPSGIFKSNDSGETWTAADTGLPYYARVDALVINPAKTTTLYAGTNVGVFESPNSGGRWVFLRTGLPEPSNRGDPFVTSLALDPTGATTLYAGLIFGSVWQWSPPSGWPCSFGFVPIVLDAVGLARYTSELQLTNLGDSAATATLSYTSSMGLGTGRITETIPAGQQVVYPDAIAYLRSKGVPIPTSGNQGGTLLISAPAGLHATVRTAADTVDPQPVGRAGLAYIDTDPTSLSDTKLYVYGLRTNDADRSNLALYNMGPGPVSLKVTLVSGDDGSSFEVAGGVPLSLPAYGWYQYSGVLKLAGFSSGYAIVERVSGSGPFGAYGVVNDQKTNDGSFIPALSVAYSGNRLTVPVLVETGTFESELILANRGSATATFTLRYFESLSPAKGMGGTTAVELAAGRQMIIPQAIDFLRSKGVAIGARGEASYAGRLQIQVSGVNLGNAFAGARTSAPSPAGGEYGLFYPTIDSSQEASDSAYILGLKADAYNRSNVAVVHTGTDGSGPITLELQVRDGSEGGKAVGQPLSVTLNPGQWAQPAKFFASANGPNGYVRVRRTAGTAPWYAYGVINDGGSPGQRTDDGAYVPMVK